MTARVASTKKTSGKRAAIYLRVSLDSTGEQLGVKRHERECRRIAAERGWQIVETYTDNSISSKRGVARPEYERMRADYGAGRFDAVLCWDLDRLTRVPRELEDWIDAAEGRGLALVTANGEADLTTDGGRMYARIKAAVARAEVERKGQRQKLAYAQRVERGVVPSGVRLTGYTIKGEIIPTEAEVVRQVFARFHAGDSLHSIAAWLTETVPTRNGRPWNTSTVRGILRNARYVGRAVYGGQATEHDGKWEAIIDPDVFEMVQAILSDERRKKNRNGTHRRHLGSGLFLCAICDHPVQSNSRTQSSVTSHRYRCRDGHVTRSAAPIDAFVVEHIRLRLAMPDLARILARPADAEAKKAAVAVKAVRARIVQTEADYDADLIDARRYAAKLAKLKAELEEIESAQVRRLAGSGVASVLSTGDPVAAFDNAPLNIRRAVIDFFMTVKIGKHPQGRRGFDPSTVAIEWKA